ncbi:MAG TPA: hypothetical protein VKT78_14405 [Fimbriimonadaceae bacterium]|nr:hypothetical protein [Fimbriimonadaceae bacterium]
MLVPRIWLVALPALALVSQLSAPKPPTYAKEIAPVLNRHCATCHSESKVAPFSLVGYQNARTHAATVARVVELNYMPSWKAKAGYGEFKDCPTLSPAEKALIAGWVKAGCPEGNPADAPPTPTFTPGWRLGAPDLIVSPVKPTNIPAVRGDFYRDYLIDPHITKPTWVRAVDFRPANSGTVHHISPGLLAKAEAEKCRKLKFDHDDDSWELKTVDDIESYNNLGFWSTGAPPFQSPEGTAFLIKPGDCILLDVHYKATGKPEVEQVKVGLYFCKEPPKDEMKVKIISNNSVYLQPGEPNTRVYLIGQKYSKPTTIYAVWPHMHYLGRTFKAWVKYPAGYSKPLVCIDDWDPDWQLLYYLKQPMTVPAGAKIYVTGTYDNSRGNPRNPNTPPIVVEAGPSSKDEMLFFEVYEVTHKP